MTSEEIITAVCIIYSVTGSYIFASSTEIESIYLRILGAILWLPVAIGFGVLLIYYNIKDFLNR